MPTDGKDPATDPSKNGGDPNDTKVTFDEKQQAKVDELIREAMGRAGRDAKREADAVRAELTTLKTDLDAAKSALAGAKTAAEKKAAGDDVAALTAQIEEMKRASQGREDEFNRLKSQNQALQSDIQRSKQETLNVRKHQAMIEAASKIPFVDTSVAIKLTEPEVQWDSDHNRWVVMNAAGQPRMNSSYEPMSLEEFYTEFAAKSPYLVRGDLRTGTGSGTNPRPDVSRNGRYEVKQVFGKGSNAKIAMQLKRENPNEYHRLKEIAKQNGVI